MSEIVYEPWQPDEYPRLTRDVFGIHWNPGRGLRIVLTAQNDNNLPGLRIDFEYPRAFQGIDEGYRLADIPIGTALIYRSGRSSYLARFRENAAGTMDSFPLMHWMIVSCNQCVDVVSESEPSIAVLTG
jgi:hypothetical protein